MLATTAHAMARDLKSEPLKILLLWEEDGHKDHDKWLGWHLNTINTCKHTCHVTHNIAEFNQTDVV